MVELVPAARADIAAEAELRELLGDYCLNYRDWRTRHEFIRAASQSAGTATALDTSILKLEEDAGWISKNDPARAESQPGFIMVTYDEWFLTAFAAGSSLHAPSSAALEASLP
jgi:hypothetical protein